MSRHFCHSHIAHRTKCVPLDTLKVGQNYKNDLLNRLAIFLTKKGEFQTLDLKENARGARSSYKGIYACI